MSDDRYLIRKGREGEGFAGKWEVWEVTYAAPGIQRLERLMTVWKTHPEAVSWLEQHCKWVKHFVHTGEWRMELNPIPVPYAAEIEERWK